MKGPRLSDYDNDKQAYETAYCQFEADQDNERREQYKPNRSMTIEYFMTNAESAIQRLSDRMEDFAGRARLKYDMVTLGVYLGQISLLRDMGIMPHRVSELQSRIDEIGAEIRKEAA
jgi:hypothetical protein